MSRYLLQQRFINHYTTLQKYRNTSPLVVGVDLSGNPTKGCVDDFLPCLYRAKENGLKLSLHFAEVGAVSKAIVL